MNYFNLLSIPKLYKINQTQLQQNYYALQSQHHPDKGKLNEDKQKNLIISANINHAYNILKDDLKRAQYLLELHGIKFNDQNLNSTLDAEKLDIIWQEQEDFENINQKEQLEKFYQYKITEQKSSIEKLEKYFIENNLQDALDIVVRLKYLNKLIHNIKLKIKNANY